MDNKMQTHPLTPEELLTIKLIVKSGDVKPIYAPAIVKAYFRGRPWKMLTAEVVATETDINVRQVRCIIQRLVAEKFLVRTISGFKNKTKYYFFSEVDTSKSSTK